MNDIVSYLLTPAAQIALIIGLAEVVKKIGLKKRFIPLFDLGLGLILGTITYTVLQGNSPLIGILTGLFLGLSACGLFSGVKNVAKGEDDEGN